MKIIDGKQLSKEILENIKNEVAGLPFAPVFCDILVGQDSASVQYVGIKQKRALSLGMQFHPANFPENISTEELVSEIKKLNQIENMCGLIVQLPLPPHIDRQAVLDAIDPAIDVDCLSSVSAEKFYKGESMMGYPTALACLALLDSLNLDLAKQNILVLGQGMLVGRPVTALLQMRGLVVNTANKSTSNTAELIKNADVIISGLGLGKYLTGDMVKEGVVVIDAGTSEENGSIVGDADSVSLEAKASYLTPTPGGVGPVTVAMLFKNVLQVAKNKGNESR